MRPLMIIGAGGHGKVVKDIARACGYQQIGFLDDADLPGLAGKVCDYEDYISTSDFVIAIGNNAVRGRLFEELDKKNAIIVSLVHPYAAVSDSAVIGKGTVVVAGAVINADTVIGQGVILNTGSSVDHDCVVEDFCHVSVGAHVCGTVHIGKRTMVGAGATIVNNLEVCEDCMIGAGAVVVKNIEEQGTYIGVPARKMA